jgi:hypothetical protein
MKMEKRKTGQTTRQINMYIKDMIDHPGQSYQIVDHYNDVHNNSIMVKRIEHRLQHEYPNMVDVYHTMDNYGVTATGRNTMCVRYSPYVLLDRDIFIGRVVDEVVESLFKNMNKPVNILEITQRVYKDNPKMLFPTLNNDFCDKVIKHTLDRLKYEHYITNIDNRLSSEYNVSKESLISQDNRYFVMTLYSPDFLEAKLSLKVDVDNFDVFKDVYKEYNAVIDTCVSKDISDTSSNDWIKLTSDEHLLTTISSNICVGSIDANCNSVIDKFEELEKMVEELNKELKNKDKYKTPVLKPKYDEFNLFK